MQLVDERADVGDRGAQRVLQPLQHLLGCSRVALDQIGGGDAGQLGGRQRGGQPVVQVAPHPAPLLLAGEHEVLAGLPEVPAGPPQVGSHPCPVHRRPGAVRELGQQGTLVPTHRHVPVVPDEQPADLLAAMDHQVGEHPAGRGAVLDDHRRRVARADLDGDVRRVEALPDHRDHLVGHLLVRHRLREPATELPEGDTWPGAHREAGSSPDARGPGCRRTRDDTPESLERVHGHSIAPGVTLSVLRCSVSRSG